jgi:predicted RNA-binding Zn-ribbon protein involved in translation (DUF1610 family)
MDKAINYCLNCDRLIIPKQVHEDEKSVYFICPLCGLEIFEESEEEYS